MTSEMRSRDRVLAACAFERPDRMPRFENFWEYPESWERRLGPKEALSDIMVWAPTEGTFPCRACTLREEGGWRYDIDEWGQTRRCKADGYFFQSVEVAMPAGVDMDSIQFESPHIDERYLLGTPGLDELSEELQQTHARYCLFGKTGGPYSRTVYVRGETQFLMDIAADPPLARAIADKLADHLTAIGIEEIRRWGLQQTGIFIYDDMAGNNGPMFHADSFEKVFLPAYRRMISAYKQAGARYVFLHSDGDVRLLLDMLVDAGIDGIHPVERRAGMDMEQLRRRFPKLVLIGGMDNTGTLINGPVEKVRAEARRIIDLGRDGGVIIGTHSISPEIPRDNFIAYHETCLAYGDFA